MPLFRNNTKGFTLIELLVVISIITLMSSVVLASLTSARDKAIDSRKNQLAREYIKALALYFSNNGAYPNSGANVSICLGTGNPGNRCLNNTATQSSGINTALTPYIPGPPASLDNVMIGTANYRGIGYQCIGTPTCTTQFALYWVLRGTDGGGCAGGKLGNTTDTPIGTFTAQNALCVFRSDGSSYPEN